MDYVSVFVVVSVKCSKSFLIFSIVVLTIVYAIFQLPVKDIDNDSALGVQVDLSQGMIAKGDLNDVTGPYVLHIFSSWCPACRTQHHVIKRLAKETDIKVVALIRKDNMAQVAEFLDKYGNPYDVLLLDSDQAVSKSLNVKLVPTSFVVDGSGKVVYVHVGRLAYGEFYDDISKFF